MSSKDTWYMCYHFSVSYLTVPQSLKTLCPHVLLALKITASRLMGLQFPKSADRHLKKQELSLEVIKYPCCINTNVLGHKTLQTVNYATQKNRWSNIYTLCWSCYQVSLKILETRGRSLLHKLSDADQPTNQPSHDTILSHQTLTVSIWKDVYHCMTSLFIHLEMYQM